LPLLRETILDSIWIHCSGRWLIIDDLGIVSCPTVAEELLEIIMRRYDVTQVRREEARRKELPDMQETGREIVLLSQTNILIATVSQEFLT
jgi:hypothetical protein